MGVAPYKYFTYDGENSRDYDVYLTGEGVFNAPERAVEMLEIPGRNGNYALDQGKFNNISVTYKAGIVDVSESNFADKVSAVRNWLCSKVGYKRLSDDYNPNEYRMAVFKSGVNIDHVDLKTGEFEITFDCKPQRWLTSGETATAVANNGTLSNPTLFDSEPLLAVKGYGTIGFNGYDINVENALIGDTLLIDTMGVTGGTSVSKSYISGIINNGDTITFNGAVFNVGIEYASKNAFTIPTINNTNASFSAVGENVSTTNYRRIRFTVSAEPLTFLAGTDSTVSNTVSGTNTYVTFSFTTTISYTASTRTFSMTITSLSLSSGWSVMSSLSSAYKIIGGPVNGYSTVSALGNPTYIDCDIGECYMYNSNNEIVSLNGNIDLGSDLPKLSSGTNTFTYDNTITELKVTPRWWKV